jgi:hypothetical protein
MIHLSDRMGLSAFGLRTAREAAPPADLRGAASSLDMEFLGGATAIGSDVNAAVRGSSVAQHAANVLSHVLCGDES